MQNSRSRSACVIGVLLALLTVGVAAQTVRGPFTQLPSLRVESAGSAGAPSVSFVGDTTSGFYLPTTGTIGFSGNLVPSADATYDFGSSGVRIRNLFASGTISGGAFSFANGTAGAPSITFTSATTKGFYLNDANTIGVSGFLGAGADATYDIGLAATKRFRNAYFSGVLAAGAVQVGAGAASASNISLNSAVDPGFLAVRLGDDSAYGSLYALQVDVGSVVVDPTYGVAQPACAVGVRGMVFFVAGATGIADQLQVCGRSADSSYYWITLQ